jgi:hypothetical protein
MYAKIVFEEYNMLVEFDKLIEHSGRITLEGKGDVILELVYSELPETHVFVMNDDGKTIDRYHINLERGE